MSINSNVLLLNNTYEAINICSMKRALKLLFKDVAVVEEATDFEIYSADRTFVAPSVIRLVNFVNLPKRKVIMSRKNVFLRDKFVCQYCGKPFKPEDLTIDHILPLSRGGHNVWENVVSACKKCNGKKDDHMPNEVGMHLIKKPDAPKNVSMFHIYQYLGRNRDTWKKYIFSE